MDTKDLQKQSASEGQHSTHDVTSDSIVCSRAIPRGDGTLVTAVTATELARNKAEEPKTKIAACDSDVNPSLLSPAMDSEIHCVGGADYDPEIMTALSNENTFKVEAEYTRKGNDSPVLAAFIISEKAELKSDVSAGANTDANPSSYFTMNFGTESPAKDDNLENTTAIWSTGSSTSRAKKTTTKATSHNTTTTSFMNSNFILNTTPNNTTATPNTNSNFILNAHGNINNKNGLSLMAVLVFLIFVNSIIALLSMTKYIEGFVISWCIGASLLFLLTLGIVNFRMKNFNTRTSINGPRDKYPPDSYSFVALYSPTTDIDAFSFGVLVFLFQGALFLLLIMSVMVPKIRTSGEVDNPYETKFYGGFVRVNMEEDHQQVY